MLQASKTGRIWCTKGLVARPKKFEKWSEIWMMDVIFEFPMIFSHFTNFISINIHKSKKFHSGWVWLSMVEDGWGWLSMVEYGRLPWNWRWNPRWYFWKESSWNWCAWLEAMEKLVQWNVSPNNMENMWPAQQKRGSNHNQRTLGFERQNSLVNWKLPHMKSILMANFHSKNM